MAIRSLSAPNARETQMNITGQGVNRPSKRVRLVLRYAIRCAALGCFTAAIASSGGCSIGTNAAKALCRHDKIDEWMIDYRNRAMAAKAWHCRKEQFAHRHHMDEFQAGFYAGYENIACGGTGCVPAIVPKEYWGWKHQSADGQAGVNSWFEGYPMGVQAAEIDGIGNWSQIRPIGIPGPVSNNAAGLPAPVQGDVPLNAMPPMDGAIQGPVIYENMPSGTSGSGVMLENGPQVLLNNATSNYRATPTTQAPASLSPQVASSVDSSSGTNAASLQSTGFVTDGNVSPVAATSDQVDSTQSLKALFGAQAKSAGDSSSGGATGASASINDDANEIPFSFK